MWNYDLKLVLKIHIFDTEQDIGCSFDKMSKKSREVCAENVPTSLLESRKRRPSPEECNKIFLEGPVNHQRKQHKNAEKFLAGNISRILV